MSFKDLATKAAALLKPKPPESSNNEPKIITPDSGSKSSAQNSTKS